MWFSGHFVSRDEDQVAIKPVIVDDVKAMCCTMRQTSVVSVKTMRSFAGKVSAMTSFVIMLRSFVSEMWEGLWHANQHIRALVNSIWVQQVVNTVACVAAIIAGAKGSLGPRMSALTSALIRHLGEEAPLWPKTTLWLSTLFVNFHHR